LKGVFYTQINIVKFKVEKKGPCKIEGYTRDTPWFDSVNSLIDSVNWDIMEKWHAPD
jgi:hypothetical protein